jgi:hypothetical protein
MTAREQVAEMKRPVALRGVLSLATSSSRLLPQKIRAPRRHPLPQALRCAPQLRASLHDFTPDRKIIRNRFTLGADNYVHNITNYAVSNKSLSTLTPRYYRYTPLYSRVRLQQNPHHHPPLTDTHTQTLDATDASTTVRGRPSTTDCSAACGIRVGELRPRDRVGPARKATVWPAWQTGERNCISSSYCVLRVLQTCTSLSACLSLSSQTRNMCATG